MQIKVQENVCGRAVIGLGFGFSVYSTSDWTTMWHSQLIA